MLISGWLIRKLVRNGRDRDAARLSGLHTKLANCSKDFLRNRASILSLLYSLSEDGNKENQVPTFFTAASNISSRTPVLRSSKSIGSGLSGYHPPLPPKPRY